jgi:hypothetical protein
LAIYADQSGNKAGNIGFAWCFNSPENQTQLKPAVLDLPVALSSASAPGVSREIIVFGTCAAVRAFERS